MGDLPVDLANEIDDPALSGSDSALTTSTEVPVQNISTADILNDTITDTSIDTSESGMSSGTIIGIVAGALLLLGGVGIAFSKGSGTGNTRNSMGNMNQRPANAV